MQHFDLQADSDLQAACQTVVHLSQHMNRLRGEAVQFQQTCATLDRGYFTPSEDDQVTHLWVSYHKARNALLELIHSTRQSVGRDVEDHPAEFLCAYAAAVVLVDAARCLRDLFSNNALVRRKLNESFDCYGISAGSFDAIQLTLTSPSNATQLNRANHFYTDHHDSLAETAAGNPVLQEVQSVIDTRLQRVQVGPRQYIRSRIAERRRDFRQRILAGSLQQLIYTVQQWGSLAVSAISTNPSHIPQLPASIAAELSTLLRPGDIFVTRKDTALTNYFLPGYWPHAAFYIGEEQVIESLKDGVRVRSMISPFGNDAVAVIRPQLDPAVITKGIDRAKTHVGKPYDFDFDFTRSDRLVCTEVVYRALEGVGDIVFTLTKRAGRQTLSAEDLLNLAVQRKHFHPVAVYCPSHGNQLQGDEAMCEILRKTMVK
ncbi:YiiX/YebB-like N1pC/P60 family cysteine hydrolase [Novipirellula rosea]|uniref:Permuted papain-like amidase enzyme, YaeF/YiiX, C92 family n=1 Tax=Novipirellula rosea TaxID=1031540 RepID=A0ABP8N7V6_9BACT